MHYTNLIHVIARTALMIGAMCGPAQAFAEGLDIAQATFAEANAKTPEVSTNDVRRILVDGSAMLVDTRTHAEFVAGHIPGARNVSNAAADSVAAVAQLTGGDKGKALVLYCNGPFCQASRSLADKLVAAGYTNVRRYQLGIPVWRALGGPTQIEIEGVQRIYGHDHTAVFIDARSADDFARGSLAGARSMPVDQFVAGALKKPPLPEDDFNTRVVLFGRDANQARALAEALSKRPWHNVTYVMGTFDGLQAALR